MLDQLAHQVPLIGAMTTRNFEEIREQLDRGSRIEPTADDQARVVARGLTKAAPFHRSKNGTADALLIELFSTALASAGKDDRYAFVTSNSEDFSAVGGDNRQPHPDLAQLFTGEHSTYRLGVEGLSKPWPRNSARSGQRSSKRTTSRRSPDDSTRSSRLSRRRSTRSGMSVRCAMTES